MSSLLLPILRESTIHRHNAGARGLRDGSIIVTITRRTDNEIRALVKSGGSEYGVTLTEHAPACSCKDALYRGTICKHSVATALFCLQEPYAEQNRIHLMWNSGEILCGTTLTPSTRFWRNWTGNALNWSDIICQTCVHTWTHPTQTKAAA